MSKITDYSFLFQSMFGTKHHKSGKPVSRIDDISVLVITFHRVFNALDICVHRTPGSSDVINFMVISCNL